MMNIVELGKFLSPDYFGGIEVMTELSAKALSAKYHVTLVCHSSDRSRREETRDRYHIIRCGTQLKKFSQPISLGMGPALRDAKPDLIHIHAPNFWAALMVELFCPRTDVIVTHHADVEGRRVLRWLLLPIYHRLARRAKCVIVNSLKNISYSKDLPKKLVRVVAIPYGLDETKYRISDIEANRALALKKGMFGQKTVIGFVGRLVWYKGISNLIDAVSEVGDVALLLVGDGPLKHSLTDQVKDLGISDRVHFAGAVTDEEKLTYMHTMDIFVLPSTHITEAYGISQIEAMLCSLPIISTSLPTGVSDISIDGETGFVVAPGNVGALREAIQRLANDASLRTSLGAQARERAINHFSENSYIRKLREEVANAIQGSPSENLAKKSTAVRRIFRGLRSRIGLARQTISRDSKQTTR